MNTNTAGINRYIFLFLISILLQNAFSEYVERIDTTDENGYGLDSAFRIASMLSGQQLVCYTEQRSGGTSNIFNYSFDEIHLAADSNSIVSNIRSLGGVEYWALYSFCFVVRNSRDGCFSKVQVINSLGSLRFVYKYGTNTSSENRTMQLSDYDRSIRYKPNNLCYRFDGQNHFFWEPPLPNDNLLLGYILYTQKKGVTIDTAASINLAQWDSIGFTDTTTYSFSRLNWAENGEYYNIVAVYTEGKSEFLKGWSTIFRPTGITYGSSAENSFSIIRIHNSQCGLSFSMNQWALPSILSIFELTGSRIYHTSNFSGSRIFWNASQQSIPPGLYLLRAEFPDRSVITQPFTIAR
jgi:hypothetical protein